ncbi:MAG: chloride channel protein [Thermoplasmatota archaeon]
MRIVKVKPHIPRSMARAASPKGRWSRFDVHEGVISLRKWGLLGIAIGIGAGLGALALLVAVRFVTHVALGLVVGYTPPFPLGEGGSTSYAPHLTRAWLIPVVTAAAGLVGGLVVWWLAPETAGIGTNAGIEAFHHNRPVKLKSAILKLGTSALTIGAGLTSGREGPIAQIGAGVGASVASLFKLTARERNIALGAGLGAGIAAIFKAPLAGAIIGAEIFYTEDFEVEALVPGLIASVVGYAIVGYATGFQPIFSLGPSAGEFAHPLSLVLFAFLGVACAAVARLAIRVFFPAQRLFQRFPLPIATAIGGALAGLVALALVFANGTPTSMGTGYGWAQVALLQNYALLPPLMLAIAVLAEIAGATFTLASGNSGGVFGPSVVTGGMLGALFGFYAHAWFPAIAPSAANFAVVGMVAYFAAMAKAPVSTIVMIAEMTGGYGLLGPAMFAVVTAFLLSGSGTIFPAQVRTRLDSPYHADEFEPLLLRRIRIAEVMDARPLMLDPEFRVEDAIAMLSKSGRDAAPVLEHDALVGVVTISRLLRVRESERATKTVRNAMTSEFAVAHPNEDLYVAYERLTVENAAFLPIVERANPKRLLGVLTHAEIGRAIQEARAARPGGAARGAAERGRTT